MSKKFHFHRYDSAIRYHISRVLEEKGWSKSDTEANFSDQNLILNDDISKYLEYKHLLSELIQETSNDILPHSYSINDYNYESVISKVTLDYYIQQGVHQKTIPELKWLLKPSLLNNGDEIKLFNNMEELRQHYQSPNRLGGDHVLQKYVPNPALYQGKKYTFRIFAVVTNFQGVFLYHEGYVNISAFTFDLEDGFKNRKVHITNYILDGELANIQQKLASEVCDFSKVYPQMVNIVHKTLRQLLKKFPGYLRPQKTKIIELFGFDYILDADQKLWLLEVNQGPDCPMIEDHVLNESLWYPFWADIVSEFVLPIAEDTIHKPESRKFTKVLNLSESYSKIRDWRNFLP